MDDALKEVVNDFSPKEQEIVNEIILSIQKLSERKPITGFHHSFYVPGWVGFIQNIIVESKMDKEASKPFYKDKNYYEFSDWILSVTKQLVDLHVQAKPMNGEDLTQYEKQSDFIVRLIRILVDSWVDCYPEIATFMGKELEDGRITSRVGLLYMSIGDVLKSIGYEPNEEKDSGEDDLIEHFRIGGQQILALLCNALVFSIIFGIISLFYNILS